VTPLLLLRVLAVLGLTPR